MKFGTFATITIALTLTAASRPALAQEATPPPVSIAAQDAPVRSVLEAIFKQAGIKNYIIENGVAGFVTLNLTEQPMEMALKLTMRANTIPLTYSKENGVWIVKPRRISTEVVTTLREPLTEEKATRPLYERINLIYLDPADLSKLLGGITTIPHFTRQRGGQGFSSGNGLIRGNGTPLSLGAPPGLGVGQPGPGTGAPGGG